MGHNSIAMFSLIPVMSHVLVNIATNTSSTITSLKLKKGAYIYYLPFYATFAAKLDIVSPYWGKQ